MGFSERIAAEGRAEREGVTPDRNSLGPFQRDSETSRKAAIDNYPRSGTQRATVLREVLACRDYGCTRDDLVVNTRMPPNVLTPRVKELIEGGWIEANGETRTTRAGSQADVLVATQKAREHEG